MNDNKMQRIIDFLNGKSKSISIAESITGGDVTSKLLECKNLGNVFKGSVVAYTPQAHEALLNINPLILKEYGLISREVSIEIALAVQKLVGTNLAIGISGNVSENVVQGKKPGIVFFTIVNESNISNYSLNIQIEPVHEYNTIVASQIIDEIYKLLFENK